MDEILDHWDKEKKDKHVNHFPKTIETFSPFPLSVHIMLGKEAPVVLTNLSGIMVTKLEKSLSHVRGWVNVRISIAVARF